MSITPRSFFFYFVLTSLLLIATIIAFEIAYRILYRFVPTLFVKKPITKLDYKDVLYPEGTVNRGGNLKENFDNYVLEPYGDVAYWKSNSLGFRYTQEITTQKPPRVRRIFSLGDSFTAGYRIDQKKTFSFLLEQFLNKVQDSVRYQIPIAHVSNPSSALEYLQKYGVDFNPDVVILGITIGNDFAQNYLNMDSLGIYYIDSTHFIHRKKEPKIGFHYGLENLRLPKHCVRGEGKTTLPNELYEENYDGLNRLVSYRLFKSLFTRKHQGISVVSFYSGMTKTDELFDACNGLGMYLKEPEVHIEEAYRRMDRVLEELKILSVKHNFRLIIVPFPQRFQVQHEDWQASVKDYALVADCFDLEKPNRRLAQTCKRIGLEYYDPTSFMKNSYQNTQRSLYLPNGDMHWNAFGNQVLFEFLQDKIK